MNGLSSPAMTSFIQQTQEVTKQINRGEWNNREGELARKLNTLFESNKALLVNQTIQEKDEHVADMHSLSQSLDDLKSKSTKINEFIAKLEVILNSKYEAIEKDLATLPAGNSHQIDEGVKLFRHLIQENYKGAKERFAEWIAFAEVPLSKLKLETDLLKQNHTPFKILEFRFERNGRRRGSFTSLAM